jgi:GNAT superfamily N-acetyltransferase
VNDIVVRDLRAEDRSAWEALWAGYLSFYESRLAAEVTATTFARFLDPNEPMQALVAADASSGDLLGFAHLVFHRGTWAISDLCYLEDLFVAENARQRGVARALIESIYQLADQRGLDRVYWLTHETNATARKLYDQVAEHRGFIQYRRK